MLAIWRLSENQRPWAIRLSIALVAAVLLAACGGTNTATEGAEQPATTASEDSPNPSEEVEASADIVEIDVSVAHPTSFFGIPWMVGIQEGYFEEEGIRIRNVIPGEGGATTLRNILAGDLPFGEVALPAVIEGYLAGAPIQVIGGAVQTVFELSWITMPDRSDIETVEDAIGKRWGFTNPGSVTEAYIYALLDKYGIGTDEVELVGTGGSGPGLALLEAGDIDIFYVSRRNFDPDVHREWFQWAEELPDFQQTVILTNQGYAQQNPEQAEGLLRAYQRSVEWIHANPDEAGEMYAQEIELDPGVGVALVNDAVAANHWSIAFNGTALQTVETSMAYTSGLEGVPWSAIFTQDFLPDDMKGELPPDTASVEE